MEKEYVICLKENDKIQVLSDFEWSYIVEEATLYHLTTAEEILSFWKRFNPVILGKQSKNAYIMRLVDKEDKYTQPIRRTKMSKDKELLEKLSQITEANNLYNELHQKCADLHQQSEKATQDLIKQKHVVRNLAVEISKFIPGFDILLTNLSITDRI